MPEKVGNVAWGGGDGKTLYIVASSSVYRIDLKIPERLHSLWQVNAVLATVLPNQRSMVSLVLLHQL